MLRAVLCSDPSCGVVQYQYNVTGVSMSLVDYYVSATDLKGNVGRSEIQHVWVDQASPQDQELWIVRQD
jgi:hypothetical protein